MQSSTLTQLASTRVEAPPVAVQEFGILPAGVASLFCVSASGSPVNSEPGSGRLRDALVGRDDDDRDDRDDDDDVFDDDDDFDDDDEFDDEDDFDDEEYLDDEAEDDVDDFDLMEGDEDDDF